MDSQKLDLFRLHPASDGLDHEALSEISSALELVRFESGEYVLQGNEVATAVYLIVRGRLRVKFLGSDGGTIMERALFPGDQFGSVAAVMGESALLECIAVDPSTVLKLEYRKGIELCRRYPPLRNNFVQLVARSVKNAIIGENPQNRPRTAGFFHQSSITRQISARLFDRLAGLGETLFVLTDQSDRSTTSQIQYHQLISGDREMSSAELARHVPQWLRQGRVFADVEASIDVQKAVQAFETFAQLYWCVTPGNWHESVPRLKHILERSPSWRDKVSIVWLLNHEEVAPLAPELRSLASRDVKVAFHEPAPNRGRALAGGLERLVHLVRGVQIGIALGGGAARGMAHLGVLKALEQNGITVDMIAGTSAGAMTGTVYASGLDVDYAIDRFVNDLRPSWLFRILPKGDQWYLLYKYRARQFGPMLRKYLFDYCLEQLPIPNHAITLDLISGRTVVRDQGDAVQGILESINLPLLSKPINREGQSLVDGGLVNNVPADVLARKGCNMIIAVNVTGKMETEFVKNRPDTPTNQMQAASTIQTLLRSYLVQSFNINAFGIEPADIVIEPDVTQFELTEFTRTDELAAVGEQSTLAVLKQIRAQLHQIDPQLFPLQQP